MDSKDNFLTYFYKCMLAWGVLSMLMSLIFSGRLGVWSYFLGYFSISLILVLWDISLRMTLKAKKTNVLWETMLVFLRYGLLGGLFYAIMRWLSVSWPWYFAGVATILPALLTSALLHKEADNVS